MYADTKRSYEHIVQTNQITNPQLSALHLKLRIQKDRLFAWGLEWKDSGAAQSGDIDGSLDRAGISDLVASIMSSISELLDEAERMRPQRMKELPGAFPDDKSGDLTRLDAQWTSQNIVRLEDIVKDLTTSIDTLCDLSRTQQVLSREVDAHGVLQSSSKSPAAGFEKGQNFEPPRHERSSYQKTPPVLLPNSPGLVSSTRLYPDQIRIPESKAVPRSPPPSYESVTAGSEDRVFAYLRITPVLEDVRSPGHDCPSEKAVLLDYGCVQDFDTFHARLPSLQRYEDLVLAFQSSQPNAVDACARRMKIVGWFKDPRRLRYVFVYEVPDPPLGIHIQSKGSSMPHSLFSYLQHGADSDSSNMPSLEDRYRLAFSLASTVLHLHAKGLTHRNINSSNVIFFTEDGPLDSHDDKTWKLGVIRHPFMTSFDQCNEDAPNQHEEPFISSIYRHPRVERGQRSSYKSAHDYYSLGLILLEIGLWMPIHKLWKPKYARSDFKSRMQSVYIKKLAAKCGSTYMRVVDYCLRSADGEVQSQDHVQHRLHKVQESTKLQTSYYWKAVRPLERCCSIDDLEEPGARSSPSNAVTEAELPNMEIHAHIPETESQIASSKSEMKAQELKPPITNEDAKVQIQPKRKLKIWSHELPIPCAKHWYAIMLPELERILKKIIDRWESYSIDLFMVGETAEQARPTIYMMCASVDKARKALQHVNRDKKMFDIKVVKGQISRSKASKKKRRGKKDDKSFKKTNSDDAQISTEDIYKSNPHYQQKPACGASIGAYMDKQHLPPVSFGGTVLVDGEPYGMSVHHMLENDDVDLGLDDTVNFERSMASSDGTMTFNEDIVGNPWSPGDLPEALYPFEISEDEDEGYQSSAGDDESWLFDDPASDHDFEDDTDVEMGDTLGIQPSEGKDLIVTQPAIDDVKGGFFPNEEDMDEEHLSSHSLGHIHASSGIKRANRGAILHEIDWALIKVNVDRLRETNVVTGGALHCESILSQKAKGLDREGISSSPVHESASYPCQVVKTEELGGLRVHSLGRTSGLQTGVILPTMTMVKMPGRVSSSHSWQVMGNFGGTFHLQRYFILGNY